MSDDKPSFSQEKCLDTASIQREDYEQILRMQKGTEGKTVVVEGGGYTAEAWELENKLQVLKQLRLARRLRATMEAAYEDAKQSNDKKKCLEILTGHKNTILEMVSLTDAVRGGYTLDSYDDYKLDERREQDRLRHLNAQSTFSVIRKKLARERYAGDRSHIQKRKRDEGSVVTRKNNSESKPIEKTNTFEKKRKIDDTSATFEQSTAAPKNDVPSTKKKHVDLPKSPKQTTRKCHYCKKARADYIPCTYWHITGKQCKKSFCLACIAANPRFNKISEGEKEFHCPACLGTCDCDSCLRFREHERQNARTSKRLVQSNSSG